MTTISRVWAGVGIAVAALLGLGVPGDGAAQDVGSEEDLSRFVARTREAVAPLRDREEAIRSGFRRLGPDFPGMGEHWVHPARIVSGLIDPSRPPVLSYVVVDGEPTLVGVAFALPLAEGEQPPSAPFGRHAWHDHTGAVDEETLLLNSVASAHAPPSGFRLSMVHVWTDLPNLEGDLAQNNWALPFVRVGLPAPDAISIPAARGVSLADGGREFYRELIRRAATLSDDEVARVERVLDRHAGRAEALVARHGPGVDRRPAVDQAAFERVWRDFWEEVESVLPSARWEVLAAFVEG